MPYKAPETPKEEWTNDQLEAHIEHLETQEKLARIEALEQANANTKKPAPKPEDSNEDDTHLDADKNFMDEAFTEFEKLEAPKEKA